MMLRFQWDSLWRGDHIVVHDAEPADLGLRPADVLLLHGRASGDDVAVRDTDDQDAERVVRHRRFVAHFVSLVHDASGGQCDELTAAA